MHSEDSVPIGELARRTGVNPVTLRAWERRYGLLVPERTPKGHRLYSTLHIERVQAILQWLERGASVSQVRDLLENRNEASPKLEGDWQARCQQLIDAIADLAQRSLDQQLNQAMALYPASTLCEQLLLPLLERLEQRWRKHFDASLEQAFFHTWLRSKLGARVYHNNHSLEGPPVLLATTLDAPFDAQLWLCAWLLSSSGFAVEVLEQPVGCKQLLHAIAQLAPRALVLHLGPRIDLQALAPLRDVTLTKLLGGASVFINEERLRSLELPALQLFETPQGALRLLQQSLNPTVRDPEMQLIWLRSDLRISDNTALSTATAQGPTLALWIASPGQWQAHDDAPSKVDFWIRNLRDLRQSLERLNIPLLIRHTDTWQQVPETVLEVCRTHKVQTVHWNDEYGVNESQRDQRTQSLLERSGVATRTYLDQLFFHPGTLLTKAGNYFQVFGQFRKTCLEHLHRSLPSLAHPVKPQAPLAIASDSIPRHIEGFDTPAQTLRDHWPAGEDEAQGRLSRFVDETIDDYQTLRDLPARPGTSQLSPYLAAGVISPRQCLHAALSSNRGEFDSGSQGVRTWIDELLWREFYKHILVGYPQVSRHRPFRAPTEALPWRDAPDELEAWEQGRTGFPLIDAAMRQLLHTGWMHNRLRMVVAMFLSKNLLIDWRKGERHFMRHLIDGDLAANNGGWQWSASTGTDSVPYFRIFNPVTQSQRFDPQGRFIRHWLPELTHLDDKHIHLPMKSSGLFDTSVYISPIVDLDSSRHRALAAFKALPTPIN